MTVTVFQLVAAITFVPSAVLSVVAMWALFQPASSSDDRSRGFLVACVVVPMAIAAFLVATGFVRVVMP